MRHVCRVRVLTGRGFSASFLVAIAGAHGLNVEQRRTPAAPGLPQLLVNQLDTYCTTQGIHSEPACMAQEVTRIAAMMQGGGSTP